MSAPTSGEVAGLIEKLRERASNTMLKVDQSAMREAADALQSLIAIEPVEATAEPVAHPDDLAVNRFAAAMKAKLARKRAEGRGGWENKDECSAEFLSELLRGHVEKGDPVDVGNLSMMLHQRHERIASPQGREETQGMVLVPREPTEAMKRAGYDAFLAAHDPFFSKNEPSGPIYRAMVDAALASPPTDKTNGAQS